MIQVLVISTLLAGCSARTGGLGNIEATREESLVETPAEVEHGELLVLLVSVEDALDLALRAAELETFDRIAVIDDRSALSIIHDNAFLGRAKLIVCPVVVEDADGSRQGITFDYEVIGAGNDPDIGFWHGATLPAYILTPFLSALEAFVEDNNVPVAMFSSYRRLKGLGVTEKIAASIPTSFEGFSKYLEGRDELFDFEGIWMGEDGETTIGIIRDL